MELNLQKQSITINETIYDGYVEQPIECDALLPDYCPDIVKVLKCTVSTNIGSTAINGERLTIEGIASAHVYYLSDKGGIRRTEYKIPFAKALDLPSAPIYPDVAVKPTVDYVNCRAVNQRRVDIRGAISLAVKVTDTKEEEVVSDAQGGGLQMRREMVQATDLAGRYDSSFDVAENLELNHGMPPVNTILRVDSRINIQDYKVVSGKVVVKGDFILHVCYQPLEDENKLETMEYALPLSQIIEADGIGDDCVCDVEMAVTSCDVQPKQNEDGEYVQLALDSKAKATVTAYRNKEMPVACDCYSTQYECSAKVRPVTFLKLIDIVRESIPHKTNLDLPEGLETVLDAWCDVDSLTWKQEGGDINVSVGLNVCLFARMEDGECAYFEQTTTAEHTIKTQAGVCNLLFEPSADVISCAYNIVGMESIEIRCDVLLRGCVLCEIKCNSLGDIVVDEEQPKTRPSNKLIIYYAEAGESIWNIAKSYNTSANAIWEENSVQEDILPGKAMLLIPIV